ncbi:MAG: glycosyltransferase family 39 protein [Anaerolineae bacterium]|nr:glycosyltransferase family 39 protein [Anaerolineae bacterium]
MLGAGLRFAALASVADNRFHVDEALYATHARAVASGSDPLLLAFDVDKPPLGTYITAAAFAVLGVGEVAARIPDLFASVLGLAALWALARRLYGRDPTVAFFAVLLLALSPYDILFAPTVFAEPQVTLWVLLACRASAGGRWRWAGLFLALALATKQSALFYFPPVVALGVVHAGVKQSLHHRDTKNTEKKRKWRKIYIKLRALCVPVAKILFSLALPLLVCAILLALWDAPRGPERSFWALNLAHNMPDRWIRAAEVLPRLATWGFWLSTLTGAPVLNAALLVAGTAGLVSAIRWRPGRRATLVDLVLVGFAIAYLGLVWLRAFNIYDRYIHTLGPLLALPAARGSAAALKHAGRPATVLAALLAAALLVEPLGAALAGQTPVGGDKGQHDGIDRAAAFLDTLPAGTPVCHHWLGWELGFYLGETPAVSLTWYPRPGALADALARGDIAAPCYLPAPADAPVARWLGTVKAAGFDAEEVFVAHDRRGAVSLVMYIISKTEFVH